MISDTSKELYQEFEGDLVGNIAFMGGLEPCSNFASRVVKTVGVYSLSPELATFSDLTPVGNPVADFYYAGEWGWGGLPTFKVDTTLCVVVTDDEERFKIISSACAEIGVPCQHFIASESKGRLRQHLLLEDSDIATLRALEELYLKDTPLYLERQTLRREIESQCVHIVPTPKAGGGESAPSPILTIDELLGIQVGVVYEEEDGVSGVDSVLAKEEEQAESNKTENPL